MNRRERRKLQKQGVQVLKFIIAESGFELLARIEIKDKKTGRCFR